MHSNRLDGQSNYQLYVKSGWIRLICILSRPFTSQWQVLVQYPLYLQWLAKTAQIEPNF